MIPNISEDAKKMILRYIRQGARLMAELISDLEGMPEEKEANIKELMDRFDTKMGIHEKIIT